VQGGIFTAASSEHSFALVKRHAKTEHHAAAYAGDSAIQIKWSVQSHREHFFHTRRSAE
jgi:acyl-CoA thioesterase FadM